MNCPKCNSKRLQSDYCDTTNYAIDYSICLKCGFIIENQRIKIEKEEPINIWSKENQAKLKRIIEWEKNHSSGIGDGVVE